MAILAEQPLFARSSTHDLSVFGAQIGAAWEGLGLLGRRAVVTAVGAVFALTCGAAVAGAVRLPADMQSAAQPDEMTVQTELPSEAAARAYALENPPSYNLSAKTDTDTAPQVDSAPSLTTAPDEEALRAAYADPSSGNAEKAEPTDHAAAAEGSSAPASGDSGV